MYFNKSDQVKQKEENERRNTLQVDIKNLVAPREQKDP